MINIHIRQRERDAALTMRHKVEGAVEQGLEDIGRRVAENAKRRVAQNTRSSGRATGALADGINHVIEHQTVIIGTTVPYAAFVEFGTYKQAARPFLLPALEDAHGAIMEIIKGRLRQIIGGTAV